MVSAPVLSLLLRAFEASSRLVLSLDGEEDAESADFELLVVSLRMLGEAGWLMWLKW